MSVVVSSCWFGGSMEGREAPGSRLISPSLCSLGWQKMKMRSQSRPKGPYASGAQGCRHRFSSAGRYFFCLYFLFYLFSFIILLGINPPSHNPPGSSGWRSRRCLPTRCSSIVPKMHFVHVQEGIIVLLWGFIPLCCHYTLLTGRTLTAANK